MRKAAFTLLALVLAAMPAHADTPSLRVELSAAVDEIPFGQYEVPVHIKITNTGAVDLPFPDLDYRASGMPPEYRAHLITDDPASFELNLDRLIGTNGPIPTVTLKPGETLDKPMAMRTRAGRLASSVSFKVGFMLSQKSGTVWSNPLTVKIGGIPKLDGKDVPLAIEAALKNFNVYTSQGQVHVKITNTGTAAQSITGPGIPAPAPSLIPAPAVPPGEAPWGYSFAPLVSDNRAVTVDSGTTSCNDQFREHDGLTLKPGETWEQDCRVIYEGDTKVGPKTATFRIGLLSPGLNPLWSNEVTLTILRVQR